MKERQGGDVGQLKALFADLEHFHNYGEIDEGFEVTQRQMELLKEFIVTKEIEASQKHERGNDKIQPGQQWVSYDQDYVDHGLIGTIVSVTGDGAGIHIRFPDEARHWLSDLDLYISRKQFLIRFIQVFVAKEWGDA